MSGFFQVPGVHPSLNRYRVVRIWDFLAGTDSLDFHNYGASYRASTRGLALPDSVLRKFYSGNALRVLGLVRNSIP